MERKFPLSLKTRSGDGSVLMLSIKPIFAKTYFDLLDTIKYEQGKY